MSNIVQMPVPRDNRIKRIMEDKTFDSEDERDAMVFALYRFSEPDFNIVWAWHINGGEV